MTPTLMASAVCPTPEPLAATPDDGGDAQYFALANKLGVRNAFIVRRELENALREEGIRVYDRKAVDAWMDLLVKKENDRLRKEWELTASPEDIADFVASQSKGRLFADVRRFFTNGPTRVYWGWRRVRGEISDGSSIMAGLYRHAIPFAALMTMDKVISHIPDAAFLISDYEAELPDPFLLVTHDLLGADGFVIERWNEPGFRG